MARLIFLPVWIVLTLSVTMPAVAGQTHCLG